MPASNKPKIVVIQGPTAGGKTGLSLEIAARYDGEIVNADSVQMVRDFDIGSAKPSAKERAQAPHHLFDVIDADQHSDVGTYTELAHPTIADIYMRGKLPIVVGGTMLYVKALLGGLVDLPKRDDNLRAYYDGILAERGPGGLFAELLVRDPLAERFIDGDNPRRVIRALEVLELTGKPIWTWQQEHRFADKPYQAFNVMLDPDMAELEAKIKRRSDWMLEAGLVAETRRLLERFADRKLKIWGAIGYAQVLDFLDGRLDESELAERIRIATLQYAKKQRRWLKREADLRWFTPDPGARFFDELSRFLND